MVSFFWSRRGRLPLLKTGKRQTPAALAFPNISIVTFVTDELGGNCLISPLIIWHENAMIGPVGR